LALGLSCFFELMALEMIGGWVLACRKG